MALASSCLTDHIVRDAPFAGNVHQIQTIQAFDADEHAHNLTDWEQSYDQITPGHFHGTLAELQLPQMQVFRENTSQAVRQSCCVWPDTFWFGMPEQTGQTRINGRLAGQDAIMVRPGHCEFELLTPADYAIFGIVVRRNALLQAADQMDCRLDWTQLAGAEPCNIVSRTCSISVRCSTCVSSASTVHAGICGKTCQTPGRCAMLRQIGASGISASSPAITGNYLGRVRRNRCASVRIDTWSGEFS